MLKVDEDEEDVEGAKQSFDEQGIFTGKLQKNDGHVVYVVQKVLISAKDDMRVGCHVAFHAIGSLTLLGIIILLKHSVFSAVSAAVVASEYLRTKKLVVVSICLRPLLLLFACSPCNVVICLIPKRNEP